MDISDEDLFCFWTALNKNNVQYILIGEFAMYFHGFKHFADDIDLLIEDSPLNRQNIKKTFEELEIAGCDLIEKIQFDIENPDFSLKNGLHIDIMTSLKGVDLSFDECLAIAPIAEIEGVMVPILHINHLIQNKKVVNRPKDQIDVMELEKIQKILAEQKRET